jgi:hypothetical protein
VDVTNCFLNSETNVNVTRKDKIKYLEKQKLLNLKENLKQEKKCFNKPFINYVNFKQTENQIKNVNIKYNDLRKLCSDDWSKMTKEEKQKWAEWSKDKNRSSFNQTGTTLYQVSPTSTVSFISNGVINLIDDEDMTD